MILDMVIYVTLINLTEMECIQLYPTKKETHHLELFNSREDHK